MPSTTESRWQRITTVVLALLMAVGIWYVVIGSEQVDAQFDMRLDYRGLPEGLVVRNGMVNKITVRLRGSAELMRGLNSRDLTYTVDLAGMQRGANVLPLTADTMPEFRAYEVLEVIPARLMLEVDVLTERVLPLEAVFVPLPDDSPLRVSDISLTPAYATIKGPETVVNPLQSLSVPYDPAREMAVGNKAITVAVSAPEQVIVTPPVTTLRYSLSLKTREVALERIVQMEAPNRNLFTLEPRRVRLRVEVPEGKVEDAEYLAAIRVVVQPPANLEPGTADPAIVLPLLPEGARLVAVEPASITVTGASLPVSPDSGDSAATIP